MIFPERKYYLHYFYDDAVCFLDYFSAKDTVIFLDAPGE